MHLGKHLLILLVYHNHCQLLVFNEIPSLVVKGFESDTSIASFLGLFFEGQLDIDSFRDDLRNRSGRTILSILKNTSRKVEKTIDYNISELS